MLDQLRTVTGFDEDRFIAAHQQPAVTSVRLHPLKPTGSFIDEKPVPWCRQGRYLRERPVFTLDPVFHAGGYYVQEASSMFLDHLLRELLPERTNLRALDLCGAPGGKTTLLADLLDKRSLLISNEVIRSRASILEENAVRWGYTNNWVTSNDPKDFGRLKGYFDLIVIDAPCSGSGLFRKDERALQDWSEANVLLCSQRQQRIIADVWEALKEDGLLVYATCSYSPEEDEAILDWMHENFMVRSLEVHVPAEWGITETRSKNRLAGYRFFPGSVNGEGFFIAAVQKKETAEYSAYRKIRTAHDPKAFARASFLLAEGDYSCIAIGESFHTLLPEHETDLQLLQKHKLYLRKAGLALGMPSLKEWLPAHDIALSTARAMEIASLELDREKALRFLKKEDLRLTAAEKGWLLVTHRGLGLGWIKSLGNRFNNYLPKHWRIRMEIAEE